MNLIGGSFFGGMSFPMEVSTDYNAQIFAIKSLMSNSYSYSIIKGSFRDYMISSFVVLSISIRFVSMVSELSEEVLSSLLFSFIFIIIIINILQ